MFDPEIVIVQEEVVAFQKLLYVIHHHIKLLPAEVVMHLIVDVPAFNVNQVFVTFQLEDVSQVQDHIFTTLLRVHIDANGAVTD